MHFANCAALTACLHDQNKSGILK